MKTVRIFLWLAVALVAGWLGYQTFIRPQLAEQTPSVGMGIAEIGGAFTAQDAEGKPISQDDLRGRPHALFFGFTHCPDVCPTTLYEASQWLERLGAKGDKLDVYFVTVDPERDTAEVLRDYISPFDARIRAITGSKEQMADMAATWRVFARKVPLDSETPVGDNYTMDHTATTFLMNADGSFAGTIAYGEDSSVAVQKLERLIDRNS